MNEKLYSTGDVAERLGLRRYQLDYLLETNQILEPLQRVAGKRVWTKEELDRAEAVLRAKRKEEEYWKGRRSRYE